MNKIKVSDSEFKIMEVIWRKNPITSSEIVNALKQTTQWDPKTIHTFLRRLVSKKVVKAEKQGNFYQYSPNINRDEYVISETKSLIRKIYNGSISNLVLNFVNNKEISNEEAEKLKKMLDDVEKGE